jgi:hypothetical protein
MANVTQSLFGFSPQDIQAQRQAELDKRASSFAQLTPMQQAQAGFYRAGSMFGDAAASALGYEDPEIAQARARQGLLGGLDMNDPESLLKAAQSIQSSDPQASLYLRDKGTELQTARDAAAAKQQQLASLARVVQEKTGLSPEESLALAADPATVRELMKVETQVVEANGRQVLINKNTGALIKDLGAAPDKRSITNVNVNGKEEESEFAKQLGKVQATRLGAAYDKRDAALRELSTFEQLSTLPDNQLISGSLAEPRVEIANFLVTTGLASDKDAQRVSASQQFQKLSNDLVLARVKQLGYNPSDADRKFIEQTIPRLSSSAAARKQLMSFMAKVARDVSDEVSSMEAYAVQNRTLSGYKPKIPQVSIGAPTKSVSTMTDDELLKALQNSKK